MQNMLGKVRKNIEGSSSKGPSKGIKGPLNPPDGSWSPKYGFLFTEESHNMAQI